MTPQRVYLLGFMGAGKTTVGKRLADDLQWPFLDLDEEIEREAGMTIPRYFQTRGEASFRQLELKCLDRVSRREPPIVVGCGGGLPLSARNRRITEQTGVPIYLHIQPETAIERVGNDPNRPLFQDPEQVKNLWEQRQSAYQTIPHQVDANDRSPEEIVSEMKTIINKS